MSSHQTANYQREAQKNIDGVALGTGYTLEGDELEDFCKKRGLCPLCALTRTRKKVFQLFKENKWELITELNKDGSYQVYKGYCVKPTCFTLEQAKRMAGDAIAPSLSKRELLKQKSRERLRNSVDDSDEDSHVDEGFEGNRTIHAHIIDSFPSQELREESENVTPRSPDEPTLVIQKAIEGLHPKSGNIKVMELTGISLRQVDFEALANSLRVTTCLTSFTLENSQLTDANLACLASGFEAAKDIPLKKLYLRTNLIGDYGMQAMGPFLQANTTLERFDVSRNCITSQGAFSIFSAFIHNRLTRIRSLNLSQNTLWDIENETSGICQFFERNRSLRILNLEGNRLEDGSIVALAKGLKQNELCPLEKLYLGWNSIGDEGAVALATMLETNQCIRVLGLGENIIQNTGARSFLACLDSNSTLEDISGLWRNKIQRRFMVVAIRKLLLSHYRSNARRGEIHEQESSTHSGRNGLVDIDFELENRARTDSEAGTVVSTMSNDPDHAVVADSKGEPNLAHNRAATTRNSAVSGQSYRTNPSVAGSEYHFDRLVILQSTPLTSFDRQSAVNEPIPLFDCDREQASIQEALSHSVSGTVDTAIYIATLDRFSAFFEKRSDAHILHLECAGPTDQLCLENGFGAVETLSVDDLKRLVFYMNIDLQIVVISSRQAKSVGRVLIEAGVRHVVCCEHDRCYNDPVTIDFLHNFYRAAATRKNLKQAFQMALAAATNTKYTKGVRRVSDRFQLLPERTDSDSYHNIPVFFSRPVTPRSWDVSEVTSAASPNLPPLPNTFTGREVEIFEVLEAIRAVDIVRVVGPPGSGGESVVLAACHYALKRREMLDMDQLFWLPALRSVKVDEDSLFGDLELCVALLQSSTKADAWQTDDTLLGCQERVEVELEDTQCLVVLDQRRFESRNAQLGVEQFISFLLNIGTVKIVLIESRTSFDGLSLVSAISATGPDSIRLEEATIDVHPLDFKPSAHLFGEHCKFVSSGGCPAAYTASEFADLLEPTEHPDTTLATKRRAELFKKIGQGYPGEITKAALSMSKDDFMDLIVLAIRPEVYVDSMTSLNAEVEIRTMEQVQAVDDKNYHRAHSLDELLEDLELLRAEFPDLEALKEEQQMLNDELDEAVRNRRYDTANNLKREILAVKRKIMKEQRTHDRSAETTNEKMNALTNKVHTMVLETQSSFKAKWSGGQVTFGVSCGDHRDCSFVISLGSICDFSHPSQSNGVVCWTNECCHLEQTTMGKPLLRKGSADLRRELFGLPEVANTPYGSVCCVTGNAVVVGPANFGELATKCVLLTVGPFSPTFIEGDEVDGVSKDFLVTPESLAYAKSTLRSCYRSSMLLAKHADLQALALSLSVPPEDSPHYVSCLEVGLRCLVDEVPCTDLRDLHLLAQSPQEAGLLKSMLTEMGYRQI